MTSWYQRADFIWIEIRAGEDERKRRNDAGSCLDRASKSPYKLVPTMFSEADFPFGGDFFGRLEFKVSKIRGLFIRAVHFRRSTVISLVNVSTHYSIHEKIDTGNETKCGAASVRNHCVSV